LGNLREETWYRKVKGGTERQESNKSSTPRGRKGKKKKKGKKRGYDGIRTTERWEA